MASRLADFRFPPQIIWSEGQLYTFAATGLACTLLARPLKHQTQRTKDSPRGSLPVGHMPRWPITAMLQFGHGEKMRQRRIQQCIVDSATYCLHGGAEAHVLTHSSDYEDSDIAKTRRSSLRPQCCANRTQPLHPCQVAANRACLWFGLKRQGSCSKCNTRHVARHSR